MIYNEVRRGDLSHIVFKLPGLMGSIVLKDFSRETVDGHREEMPFTVQSYCSQNSF